LSSNEIFHAVFALSVCLKQIWRNTNYISSAFVVTNAFCRTVFKSAGLL